jgi:hypothetical protein
VDPRIKALRQQLAALEATTLDINSAVAQGSISSEDAVSLGVLLAGFVKKAGSSLEPLKVVLREEALAQEDGMPGPRHFTGPDGSKCTVVVPKMNLQVRKDINIEKLKEDLGDSFDLFFDTKIQYKVRKDFSKTASKHALAATAMVAIDAIDGTPRVSFKC